MMMFAAKATLKKNTATTALMQRLLSTSAKKTETLNKLFNTQITNELNASRLYLSAHVWFSGKDLTGMSKFTLQESQEEHNHALELIEFGLKRDIPIELEALMAPHAKWESPESLWAELLQAEKHNSQALYELANAAHAAQDHAVTTFLMPFHSEQVDAVDNIKTILAKVKEESKTPGMIRQLDSEMERTSGSSGGTNGA